MKLASVNYPSTQHCLCHLFDKLPTSALIFALFLPGPEIGCPFSCSPEENEKESGMYLVSLSFQLSNTISSKPNYTNPTFPWREVQIFNPPRPDPYQSLQPHLSSCPCVSTGSKLLVSLMSCCFTVLCLCFCTSLPSPTLLNLFMSQNSVLTYFLLRTWTRCSSPFTALNTQHSHFKLSLPTLDC